MTQIKAEYINHMGDDLTVVNAARVSFDKESEFIGGECTCAAPCECSCSCGAWAGEFDKLHESDKKLITYLANHNHWSPFSHPQITLRETVPIFVARQRFKHMVGFTYNEVSRRYVDDMPEFYIPSEWRSRPDGSVKQGSGDVLDYMTGWVPRTYRESLKDYEYLLGQGVAPEQARIVLPQSMFTSYYVTGSLAAFARAYKQRIDPHSQKEIQDLAKQWGDIIKPLYPVSWDALTNGQ